MRVIITVHYNNMCTRSLVYFIYKLFRVTYISKYLYGSNKNIFPSELYTCIETRRPIKKQKKNKSLTKKFKNVIWRNF